MIDQLSGHIVNLKVSNPLHFSGDNGKQGFAGAESSVSFPDMLNEAVNKVNNLQNESDDLNRKMIYEPESVEIHQVMIAAQKAEISLSLLKTVRDEALKAYREIMNMR